MRVCPADAPLRFGTDSHAGVRHTMARDRQISSVRDAPGRRASVRSPATSSPPLQPYAEPLRSVGPERLTPRERQVLGEIVRGSSNKQIGRLLEVSPRTIEVHRARIMTKLGAKNAADLVRIALSQADGR